MRQALIMAVAAWIAAGLAILAFPKLGVVVGVSILATVLTALWTAHVVRARARRRLGAALRQFGATRQEAKAILAALRAHGGSTGKNRILNEGETLRIQFAPRPTGPGERPVRIVIANPDKIIAAVALSSSGTYAALDPQDLESDSLH